MTGSHGALGLSVETFHVVVMGWIILGVILVPVQLLQTAPFGRHFSTKWGPDMDNRTGWVIMEIVSPVALWGSFFLSGAAWSSPVALLMGVWTVHYINRSVVYPLRMRTRGKRIPIVIVASAIAFNSFNGWSNGTYFGADWGIAESGSVGGSTHPSGAPAGKSVAALVGPLGEFTQVLETGSDDRIGNMGAFTVNALELMESTFLQKS